MPLKNPINIDIWKGDWGLPSIDLDCIKAMTYIKFAGAQYTSKATNNPFWSPTGTLPVIRLSNRNITTYEELVKYLDSQNMCPDAGLDDKQKALASSCAIMLHEKLYPALEFTWWVDKKNRDELTRPWYGKAMPLPFNFYYPSKYIRKADEMIKAMYNRLESDAEIELEIYKQAESCLDCLSARLSDSEFFFGQHPTSIDAILFAYLAPLLKAPFKNTKLQNRLKSLVNLNRFIIRINQRYFSTEYKAYEQTRKEELAKLKDQDSEFPNKTRNIVYASLFAFFSMLTFAVSKGIVASGRIEDDFFMDTEFDHTQENFKEDD